MVVMRDWEGGNEALDSSLTAKGAGQQYDGDGACTHTVPQMMRSSAHGCDLCLEQ